MAAAAVVAAAAAVVVVLFLVLLPIFSLYYRASSLSAKVPTLHPGLTKFGSEASRWLQVVQAAVTASYYGLVALRILSCGT